MDRLFGAWERDVRLGGPYFYLRTDDLGLVASVYRSAGDPDKFVGSCIGGQHRLYGRLGAAQMACEAELMRLEVM